MSRGNYTERGSYLSLSRLSNAFVFPTRYDVPKVTMTYAEYAVAKYTHVVKCSLSFKYALV